MEANAFPMNGGDGAYSYTKNSQYQLVDAYEADGYENYFLQSALFAPLICDISAIWRASSNVAKEMIEEAIAEKFDIKSLSSSSSNTIRIADLGCSVGPNTFIAMRNVIEAMEMKCHSHYPTTKIPEFHLFFNDHSSNDFNTLFNSLPPDRHYFAAGVPGSFHGRLFPKSSLHFVYSSIALHWLSKVPQDLLDKNSVAWNKGRIHYTSASEEVANAYAAQFGKDMEVFLNARADEIVVGGMMIVIMPALPNGVHHSQNMAGILDVLEQSLIDMVKAVSKLSAPHLGVIEATKYNGEDNFQLQKTGGKTK